MSQPTISPLDPSVFFTQLRSRISPGDVLLLGALLVLAVLASLAQRRRPKLATAYFGGLREGLCARHKARRQQRVLNKEFTLFCGKLPLSDAQRSVFISGMPGTGKSYGAIIPATLSALRQGMPIVLYDFAYPELSQSVAAYARSLGYQIHLFAPGYDESGVLNPVELLESEEDVDTARQLMQVASKNRQIHGRSGSEDGFFSRGGIGLAEGAMAFAKGTAYPDVLMANAVLALPRLTQRLQAASGTLNPWVRQSFEQLISVADSERTAAGLIASAQDIYKDFLRQRYLGALCGHSSIPLYLDGRQLVILGVDRQRRSVAAPILASVLDLLVSRNAVPGRTTPILMVVDEAPSLYLPHLDQYLAENRKYGMGWLLGVQNVSQMAKAYSRDLSHSIFATCISKILFNPGESQSAKLYSDLLGEVQVDYWQRTFNRGHKASHSVSPQHRTRKLWAPEQFLKMKQGQAILLSPGFANGKDGFVPMQHRFRVSKADRQAMAYSCEQWEELRQELEDATWQKTPTARELALYRTEAERLLPLPSN